MICYIFFTALFIHAAHLQKSEGEGATDIKMNQMPKMMGMEQPPFGLPFGQGSTGNGLMMGGQFPMGMTSFNGNEGMIPFGNQRMLPFGQQSFGNNQGIFGQSQLPYPFGGEMNNRNPFSSQLPFSQGMLQQNQMPFAGMNNGGTSFGNLGMNEQLGFSNQMNPCSRMFCSQGQICQPRQVQCFMPPCNPIGQCVPIGLGNQLGNIWGQGQFPFGNTPNSFGQNNGIMSGLTTTSNSCGRNEFFNQCTGCENTCENRNVVCNMACRQPGACRCQQGFFRHRNGNCVSGANCLSGNY